MLTRVILPAGCPWPFPSVPPIAEMDDSFFCLSRIVARYYLERGCFPPDVKEYVHRLTDEAPW